LAALRTIDNLSVDRHFVLFFCSYYVARADKPVCCSDCVCMRVSKQNATYWLFVWPVLQPMLLLLQLWLAGWCCLRVR